MNCRKLWDVEVAGFVSQFLQITACDLRKARDRLFNKGGTMKLLQYILHMGTELDVGIKSGFGRGWCAPGPRRQPARGLVMLSYLVPLKRDSTFFLSG